MFENQTVVKMLCVVENSTPSTSENGDLFRELAISHCCIALFVAMDWVDTSLGGIWKVPLYIINKV